MKSVLTAELEEKKRKAAMRAPSRQGSRKVGSAGAPAGLPRFLGAGLQRKLAVGAVNDPLEREADQIAEKVASSTGSPSSASVTASPLEPASSGSVQRKCACGGDSSGECEECRKHREDGLPAPPAIQRQASSNESSADEAPPIVHEALRSPGRPLDRSVRPQMEEHLGSDFGDVRIHTDSVATKSAHAVNALAYTAGKDVVFGAGQYAPESSTGKKLLVHELTHVAQQRGSSTPQTIQRQPQETPPTTSSQPAPSVDQSGSQPEQFWAAVEAVGATQEAKKMADEAVAKMMSEQGPRLKELAQQVDDLERSGFAEQEAYRIRALKAQMQEIFDAYDPSIQRSCPAPSFVAPFIGLPYSTTVAPLYGPPELSGLALDPMQNAVYAPDMVPDQGTRFGKYGGLQWNFDAVRSSIGDAYAYNVETDNFQVANDLERLARAGYTEIHIATGTHGSAVAGLSPEIKFLKEDARAIMETMQRHPGLKIIPYNMADPVQVATFDQLQTLAADGQLPGGATFAAFCFSRTRVYDPNPDPAGPYASTEVLQGNPPLSASYAQAALVVGFGALSFYSGMQDPNRTVGALKMAGGAAQVVGGASYAYGFAADSVNAVRWGSRLGEFGGYVTAPLVLVDVYRDMSHKFDPGVQPMKGEESVYYGVNTTMKLAGMFFPEAAAGALVLEYGVKPLAEKGSEYLTPMFVGGISQAYGIPESMVWGMH